MNELRKYANKLRTFLFVVICTIVIASCYGILHDQVTYSISHEYYTKFKFIQFGLTEEGIPVDTPRTAAIIVGIMATWWMGMFIGILFAGILLFFKTKTNIYGIYFRAVVLTFGITVLSGIAGYIYAKTELVHTGVAWYLPAELVDRDSFICVGSIHNFSYIGGVLGCMAGTLYILIRKRTVDKVERDFKIQKDRKL